MNTSSIRREHMQPEAGAEGSARRGYAVVMALFSDPGVDRWRARSASPPAGCPAR
ncbi:MAG: hypothetical protein M3N98_15670 [Actinomycetota bacterium]|nr:hypothetical protein [Actinomycetota bacterium]